MACSTQPTGLSHNQLKANFAADPTYGQGPLTVQFSDKSTGEIESWVWDFDGDGVVDSTDQNPTFVCTASGAYEISLTVSGAGETDTTTKMYYLDLD
ncbi:PKD domain-containing protein [Chloroflexota bacterium]